jgi:DNA-binding transcriptional ArsR family regulator
MVSALGAPTRWRILAELGSGEPLMVKEIAERMKCSAALVSKHIAVLKKAGLVEVGRAGMYQIPAHFVVSPQEGHVDYGHCLIRLTSSAGESPL